MQIIKILTENPNHHWGMLPIYGENVLDLGCGSDPYSRECLTTPEYFYQQHPKNLICVDISVEEISKYRLFNIAKKNNVGFYQDDISSIETLKYYLSKYNITAMKMDIEGGEQCLMSLNVNDVTMLKYIAVETHSRILFHDILFKLIELQFNIMLIGTFYPRVYHICNLIYAKK